MIHLILLLVTRAASWLGRNLSSALPTSPEIIVGEVGAHELNLTKLGIREVIEQQRTSMRRHILSRASRRPRRLGTRWLPDSCFHRSEERRVGKECRSRWSPY